MSLIRNVSLVKEASQPHIYFVCGGVKMWIPSPAEFNAMGFDWKKVQVVPDGALYSYLSRPFVALPATKPSAVFFDVADRWSIGIGGIRIKWSANTKDSRGIVQHAGHRARNVMLAGWCDTPIVNIGLPGVDLTKGNTEGVEDIWYNIRLDPDFLQRMYGFNGLSQAVDGLYLQGEPPFTAAPIPFEDRSEVDGSTRGVTFNSFMLPGGDEILHCELNAWHTKDTNYWYNDVPPLNTPRPSTKNYLGRGPAPSGWLPYTYSNQYGTYTDNWFPYNPLNPDGGQEPLSAGDYVVLKGALWQDWPHGHTPWPDAGFALQAGYLEIHPVDWIVRVESPIPGSHRSAVPIPICTEPSSSDTSIDSSRAHYPQENKFYPAFNWVDRPHLKVREVEELIDGRFTDMDTVWKHFALNMRSHVEVQVGVKHTGATQRHGRFKTAYLVTWEVPGPAVCSSNPDATRLDIFARGSDDAIYYKWYEGNPWKPTPWHCLFGTFHSDPAAVAVSPAVIYVFARGTDEAIWFTRLDLTSSGFSAANWQSMGGEFTSGPAACTLAPNQVFVFARGRDKALWYTRFNGQSWENWKSHGGVLTSDPAALAMNNLVIAFARGTDEALYYTSLDVQNWRRLEGFWASAPAVCSPDPANNVMDLFARGSDNAMWHRRFDGQDWQPWRSLGGVLASDPAAVNMGGSCVFARGTDERLWFSWLTATQTGPWQGLEVDLPPSPPPPPPPAPELVVGVIPYPVPLDTRVRVTVTATDRRTGAPATGDVKIDGIMVAATNTPFNYTFRMHKVRDSGGGWDVLPPMGIVSAPGYPDADIDFGF